MPYKISGTTEAARIIIIEESGYTIESNTNESSGAYEVDALDSSDKLVVARKSDGEVSVYGNVTPIEYTPPPRGVFAGGSNTSNDEVNTVDYITISTTGNATNFGDLLQATQHCGGASNGPTNRGTFFGGNNGSGTWFNNISYVTISTASNSTDFGDLTTHMSHLDGASNNTNNRAIVGGGYGDAYASINSIQYFTISSLGNTTDFGDLTRTRYSAGVCANGTNDRCLIAGLDAAVQSIDYITISNAANAISFGNLTARTKCDVRATSNLTNNRGVFGGSNDGSTNGNIIDYVTISSTGDATDFGDLTVPQGQAGATSNGTSERGVWGGGRTTPVNINVIGYITINSASNATDFGDLTVRRTGIGACSNA